MFAKPADYRPATQKVFYGSQGTWIGLPVVSAAGQCAECRTSIERRN
jgi:hypothetical protein